MQKKLREAKLEVSTSTSTLNNIPLDLKCEFECDGVMRV